MRIVHCFSCTNHAGIPETKVDEIWFAGNHGDVGGGWREKDKSSDVGHGQLSDITLGYMIQQAKRHGIRFDKERLNKISPPKNGRGFVHKMTLKNATRLLGGKRLRVLNLLTRISLVFTSR